MSSAADLHSSAKIVALDSEKTQQLLKWKSRAVESAGQIFKVAGFEDYNHIVDINRVFSTMPTGCPIDRTQQVQAPVKFQPYRPWAIPAVEWTLDQALEQRVASLTQLDQKINLFWSGGIDSTAMVVAFLKHADQLDQLRIFYSPFSTYEHPGYLEFISKFSTVELIDISGSVYLNKEFDGIFITGDGGDELHASIDESFFTQYGHQGLQQPWHDLFRQTNSSDKFIDFCQRYFGAAGRPIDTVLEARWFFYAVCKNRFQLTRKLDLFLNYNQFDPQRLLGFFDCNEYENFIYWNIDLVFGGTEYRDWKKILKQYCCDFDGFDNWANDKQKTNSTQIVRYSDKYRVMHDKRYIFLLSDSQLIATNNLPFFSRQEFDDTYGNQLDYLFNDPN